MKEFFMRTWLASPKIRKISGVFLVIIGFVGLVTPFTPWGVLFFVGLEILGLRLLLLDKIKNLFKK